VGAAVWAATAPIVAARFHLVSPVGLLLNPLVAPLVAVVGALLGGGGGGAELGGEERGRVVRVLGVLRRRRQQVAHGRQLRVRFADLVLARARRQRG
jgi:hypothetical protein